VRAREVANRTCLSSPQYSSAYGRWSRFGPYYAMFPVEFAEAVIGALTRKGDLVLDPFAGRGTAPYVASMMARIGVGIEINPLGWLYGEVKLHPAPEAEVLERLREIGQAGTSQMDPPSSSDGFFSKAFSPRVLSFLESARQQLNWRTDSVDRTLMALVANYLHGKLGEGLSNQMRQTKAMAPDYSVRWWESRHMEPPDVDPVNFLDQRIRWRYARGVSDISDVSHVYLGDSSHLIGEQLAGKGLKVRLVLTSPPYCDVTNYVCDQWLRLWLLGGPSRPKSIGRWGDGKLANRAEYRRLLTSVLSAARNTLTPDGTVYLRTDAREFTRDTTVLAVHEVFPDHTLWMAQRPLRKPSQTSLFGDSTAKPGDVDLVATPVDRSTRELARLETAGLGSFSIVQ
jgi:hypothetical protein